MYIYVYVCVCVCVYRLRCTDRPAVSTGVCCCLVSTAAHPNADSLSAPRDETSSRPSARGRAPASALKAPAGKGPDCGPAEGFACGSVEGDLPVAL